MKSKKVILFISVILVCSVLLACLSSCKKEEDNNNNNNNIVNTGNGGNNNPDNGLTGDKSDNDYTSREIADAVIAIYAPEDFPEDGLEFFFSGAAENSDNYIEPEKIGNLINKVPRPVQEFDYLDDFALYVPAGQSIFEVSVLKLKKEEVNNIDSLKILLEKRLKRVSRGELINYAPQELPIYENAKVIIVSNYVILLATTDNGKAENIINDMLKSGNNSSLANDDKTIVGDGVPDVPDIEIETENKTESEPETNKPVSMDEIVNVEPEILFDIDQFKTLVEDKPEQDNQPEQPDDSGVRKTAVPSVNVKNYSHNTSFMIGGKCEVGAMIRVTGGTEEIYTGSDYGDYLVEVPFSNEGTTTLKLTAELDGKLPSEETAFIVKPQKDISFYEDNGAYGVILGYNYMSYFDDCLPDYIGSNLINDREIEDLTKRTQKRIQDLRDKGCDAEIVYLLVPNTVRIWPEDMPRRYVEEKSDTLLRQWKQGATAGGATVIDLTDVMMAHKYDEFKIWHKTDSHWSEYGAYLGYVELMNYIAKKFPDAAPRPRSDFEFYNKEVNFGDIYATLGLELSDLCETSVFVNFKFDPPHFNPDYDTGHVNIYDENCIMRMSVRPLHVRVQFQHITESNLKGLKLPSVYIFRDSFEGPLHAFYTDRFSYANYRGMWNYNFNLNEIVKENPDYILYIISERNIKNVLYN